MIYVGTSGYGYHEWSPTFYPGDVCYDDYLRHYAETFSYCELSATFFCMPSARASSRMIAKVPETFRFTALTVCASLLMTVLWGFTRASVFWAVVFHWTLNISGRVAQGLLPDVQPPEGATSWLETGLMVGTTVVGA